jgi:N utilization substance protein B
MINRIIIRIKVLQIVYAFYQKNSEDLKSAENELLRSLQHSYDLYHYLLYLIVFLTNAEQKRIDIQKHKFYPTKEDMDPNLRFVNNRLAKQIRENSTLKKFISSQGVVWNSEDNPNFVKKLLTKIISSDVYAEYLNSADNYDSDREFWRKVFKHIILKEEEVQEIVNNNSIYVDDDFEVVATFVIKTIKRFNLSNGAEQELLPMFKEDEDYQFAIHLLHRTLLERGENSERIDKQIKNWELDRIALIDLLIMQIAISELKNFPSIPVNVTLNEYIDLAHYYSTPKSAHFINGILDAIVNELKSEGKLYKN